MLVINITEAAKVKKKTVEKTISVYSPFYIETKVDSINRIKIGPCNS